MQSDLILNWIIAIPVLHHFLEVYLEWRNIQHQTQSMPAVLDGIYELEQQAKSRAYQKEKTFFGLFVSSISLLLMVMAFSLGWLGTLAAHTNTWFHDPILSSLAILGIIFIVSDILGTPADYYSHFVIEEKYGFNKMTPKLWFLDKLKGYALAILIGGALMYCLFWLMLQMQTDFWWIFWLIISTVMLLINMFYTDVLVPLFNKLTPLGDGALKTAIEVYCQAQGFPLTGVYIVDGSKRSAKANAYFSGIGPRKKVVLFDTLVEQLSTEELIAVLAHEVGHYQKKHIYLGLILGIAQTGFLLWLLSNMVFSPVLSQALGSQEWNMALNLIAFVVLYTPISTLTGLIMNVISRKNEYEADAYALQSYPGGYLLQALKKLAVNNLSQLHPDHVYAFVHYSHPRLADRFGAML